MPIGVYNRDFPHFTSSQVPIVIQIGIAVTCEMCQGYGCDYCGHRGFRYKGIKEV